jgi:cytochrome oxidase Cu insertion factor (SCO1/SenC/PrrC family)
MKPELRSKTTTRAKALEWPAVLVFTLVAIAACGGNTESPPVSSSTPTDSANDNSTATPTATIGPPSDDSPSPAVGNKVGQIAPNFTLSSLDAGPVTLATLREQGKPVVLYFFTTW